MEILEWTYALQAVLQQMDEKEFAEYMKDKVIRYNGKLYGTDKPKKKTKKEKIQ